MDLGKDPQCVSATCGGGSDPCAWIPLARRVVPFPLVSMDPDQARLLLTDAAIVELFINSRAAPIHTLTAYELELLKENGSKSTEAQIARKYHKIMALLSELQPLVAKEHTMKAKAPKNNKVRKQPDSTGGEEPPTPLPTSTASGGAQGQGVPYVPHTPPPAMAVGAAASVDDVELGSRRPLDSRPWVTFDSSRYCCEACAQACEEDGSDVFLTCQLCGRSVAYEHHAPCGRTSFIACLLKICQPCFEDHECPSDSDSDLAPAAQDQMPAADAELARMPVDTQNVAVAEVAVQPCDDELVPCECPYTERPCETLVRQGSGPVGGRLCMACRSVNVHRRTCGCSCRSCWSNAYPPGGPEQQEAAGGGETRDA